MNDIDIGDNNCEEVEGGCGEDVKMMCLQFIQNIQHRHQHHQHDNQEENVNDDLDVDVTPLRVWLCHLLSLPSHTSIPFHIPLPSPPSPPPPPLPITESEVTTLDFTPNLEMDAWRAGMKRWRGTEGEMGKIMMDLGMDEEGDGECDEKDDDDLLDT